MKAIIEVNNLYKKYRIGEKQSYYSFRDTLTDLAKLPFGQKAKSKKEDFWALKNISFKVMPGEVIGIIGRNGAGKSTLLKILSRITPPTKGEITLRGRVASLLEVGTGFHPELTGRENIYLNGAVLGMKRAEINSKFDEIVEFAEISKFLDTPVKFYSSGMYMRLAFAIAAHLDPEILLVDEVLAVGDAEFQKKCLGKMKEVSKQGRTVLFVSHNMETIEKLCSRSLLFEKGAIVKSGNVTSVVNLYMKRGSNNSFKSLKSDLISMTLGIFSKNGENRNTFQVGKQMLIKVTIFSEVPLKKCDFGVGIVDSLGTRICTFHTQFQIKRKLSFQKKCEITIDWKEIIIAPGSYKFVAAIYEKGELISHWEDIGELFIIAGDYYKTGKLPDPSHQGKIVVKSKWNIIEY